jgi:hypothetical protein
VPGTVSALAFVEPPARSLRPREITGLLAAAWARRKPRVTGLADSFFNDLNCLNFRNSFWISFCGAQDFYAKSMRGTRRKC